MKRKAKPAVPARVYLAERDPRQDVVVTWKPTLKIRRSPAITFIGGAWLTGNGSYSAPTSEVAEAARRFGPWVRGADGRLERKR